MRHVSVMTARDYFSLPFLCICVCCAQSLGWKINMQVVSILYAYNNIKRHCKSYARIRAVWCSTNTYSVNLSDCVTVVTIFSHQTSTGKSYSSWYGLFIEVFIWSIRLHYSENIMCLLGDPRVTVVANTAVLCQWFLILKASVKTLWLSNIPQISGCGVLVCSE